MNKEELIDWIDRPPSNHDLDNINYIICIFKQNEQLQTENQQLKEDVKSARSVYEGLLEEVVKYKEIINKAIKFIEDDYYSMNTTNIDDIGWTSNKLLIVRNMLKESDVK